MGMGTSRLAQELITIARTRDCVVLAGRAYPLDEYLPYAPIINALGSYLRQITAPHPALANLPHLRQLIDGLPPSESEPRQGLDKVHVLENLARLVERIAQSQPLLWVIDDLHLADPATVEVFYYIARNIQNQRVLLLATYRNDEADALRHLRVPLLTLARHGLSEEIELKRLAPKEVALLTSQRLGNRPSRRLLEHLEAHTLGTPLIIEALLDSLESQNLLIRVGGAVGLSPDAAHSSSPAAREIILERLVPVGPRERRVLDFVAVMGGTAGQDDLMLAMGCERSELLAALAWLQEAGLISAQVSKGDVAVQVSLSHPFLQEVLYAELPSLVRRQYHAQVAAALEIQPNVPLERLARQYEGSGGEPDPVRALQVLLSAGEHALNTAGPEGIHYYRVALALVRGGLLPEELPTVLVRLGQALALGGELVASRTCLLEALQIHEQFGDTQAAGAMHAHLAWVEVMLADLGATEAHIRTGIEQLGPGGWSPELLTLYGQRYTVHLLRSETASLAQDVADLAQAAEVLATAAAHAWHLHARMWVEVLSGQMEAGLATATAGLEQAWLSQDPNLVVTATLNRATLLLSRGDHRLAAAELRATHARLPTAWSLIAEHMLGPMLAMAETLAGNWDAALKVSDEGAPLEPFIQGFPRASLGARAVILIRRGDLVGARACLDEANQYRRPFITDCDYAAALFALECEDYQGAAADAARLYTWALSPLGMALLAEAQAALGDAEAVRNTANFLLAMGSLNLPMVAALGTWAMGLAERTAGDATAAMATFAVAADQFERLAMPFDAARARFEQAQLLASTDRRAAANLARQSLQVFSRLGAATWVERVHRCQASPGPRAEVTKRKPSEPFSSRELEIIRLLDEGLTTAEIAERLTVSPRTVANHLDRLYTRHGVRNRLSLVHFARAGGFL